MTDVLIELLEIHYTWNHLTVCKQMSNVEQQYLILFSCVLKLKYWYNLAILGTIWLCKWMINVELVSNSNNWNHLTVYKEIINPIYPTPPLGQDMTQGQFLSRVWIQSFPSPRLVASPMLKNPVCPTIYP